VPAQVKTVAIKQEFEDFDLKPDRQSGSDNHANFLNGL
jgi:hypothetical protein